jgi:hypothetical protein
MLLSYTKDGLVCQYSMGEGRGQRKRAEEERRGRVMLLQVITKDGLVSQYRMGEGRRTEEEKRGGDATKLH